MATSSKEAASSSRGEGRSARSKGRRLRPGTVIYCFTERRPFARREGSTFHGSKRASNCCKAGLVSYSGPNHRKVASNRIDGRFALLYSNLLVRLTWSPEVATSSRLRRPKGTTRQGGVYSRPSRAGGHSVRERGRRARRSLVSSLSTLLACKEGLGLGPARAKSVVLGQGRPYSVGEAASTPKGWRRNLGGPKRAYILRPPFGTCSLLFPEGVSS